MTIQAWDRGNPVRSGYVTIPLDIIMSKMDYDGAETVHIEVDEGLPAGISTIHCLLLVLVLLSPV